VNVDHQLLTALGLAATAVVYLFGVDRLWSTPFGERVVPLRAFACFLAAELTIALATTGPGDRLADRSLAGHMVQHLLLLAVASPLLALSEPVPAFAWALPVGRRRRAMARWGRLRRELGGPRWPQWLAITLLAQVAAMVAWHLSGPYDAAVRVQWLHALEHLCFVVTATAFWWVALRARGRARRGPAVIAIFLSSLAAIGLGAAFLVSPTPLYPLYARRDGAGAIADQQLAGVVMWAYGGVAALAVGLGSFVAWLRSLERAESPSPTSPPLPSSGPSTAPPAGRPSGSGASLLRSRQMRQVR